MFKLIPLMAALFASASIYSAPQPSVTMSSQNSQLSPVATASSLFVPDMHLVAEPILSAAQNEPTISTPTKVEAKDQSHQTEVHSAHKPTSNTKVVTRPTVKPTMTTHRTTHVSTGSPSYAESKAISEQMAQELLQHALSKLPTLPQTQSQVPSGFEPTSSTQDSMNTWLEQNIGIPSSVLPTSLSQAPSSYQFNVGPGTVSVDGKTATPTYSKTISGPGYTETFAVEAGMVVVSSTGTVPSNLLPPGWN